MEEIRKRKGMMKLKNGGMVDLDLPVAEDMGEKETKEKNSKTIKYD